MANIDQKIKATKEDLCMDMTRLRNEYDELKQSVDKLKQNSSTQRVCEPVEDTERTLIMINLKEERDDALTLHDRVKEVIESMGELVSNVVVSQVRRLQSRNNKPGMVKAALDSKESNIKVLKAKGNLRSCDKYKKVWIRSSNTHTERLIELNFKTDDPWW